MTGQPASCSAWDDAVTAASLIAVDPAGAGGAVVRAAPGPVRDAWIELLRTLLPAGTPLRRLPAGTTDDRLIGGLDLAATLSAGRPVAERGLLAHAHGGILVLASAERLDVGTAARLSAAIDCGEVRVERDGLCSVSAARFAVVAFDESGPDEPGTPPSLSDRVAFRIDLAPVSVRETSVAAAHLGDVEAARCRLSEVAISDHAVEAICSAAAALGIASLRACLHAVKAACASAALDGRSAVDERDLALAARLVLAPRATVLPADADDDVPEPPRDEHDHPDDASKHDGDDARQMSETVVAAAKAALPPDVLARLAAPVPVRRGGTDTARGASRTKSARHGRPAGVRKARLQAGKRLDVLETLRAAAPWQRLRNQNGRLEIRGDDFRIKRFSQPPRRTTIFAVDASGSAALHRLAEAKGAVELLLAGSYVRRDQVALVAFRGKEAELLLPPTRSLSRVKRSLAGLPGGGATPLAAGIDTAAVLADAARRKGQSTAVVLLTDGRANMARDGKSGRAAGEADAVAAARAFRSAGLAALLIDTSPRPSASAEQIAAEMGADYLPLPHADAAQVTAAVRSVLGA